LLGEAAVLAERWRGGRAIGRLAAGRNGGGRPVLVLPGFMAADRSTGVLQRLLNLSNYRAQGWGFGRNLGISAALYDDMLAKVDGMAQRAGQPVALVGWSLGGLYAREIARQLPGRVERVVTLGSPFSGDRRANRAWRLYERIAGHPVDQPPTPCLLNEKPPVRTIALWSARDGIVAPASARGLGQEADRRVKVDCTHLGFVCAPPALTAILDALEG
jgi:pimeloyl-ACP methyl ester carboxylesterase